MNFEYPRLLWLLLIPLLLVLHYLYIELKDRRPHLRVSTLTPWKTNGHSVLGVIRHFPFALRTIALVMIVLAIARPRSSSKLDKVDSEGIDIVLAMDVSTSMLARDFNPDRISAAKDIAIEFIAQRPSDRIGIVVFASESYTQCPLTTDRATLINLMKEIQTGLIEDGTAIGNGLATAVARMKDSDAMQVARQVLGAPLGERGDEDAVLSGRDLPDLRLEVVDLVRERADLHLRIEEPGRTDHLFRHRLRHRVLVVPWRCRTVNDLIHLRVKLVERERTVVLGARQTESEFHELFFPRLVAVVHSPDLRNGHVALVDDREESFGEIVDEALRRAAGGAAGQRTRIVLDAVAVAELAHHLQVVLGPFLQSLRLEELALRLEVHEALGKLRLDPAVSGRQLVLAHHELLRRSHHRRRHRDAPLAGQRIQRRNRVDLVSEELDADRARLIRGEDVQHVAADAERARREVIVVPDILRLDQLRNQLRARDALSGLELHRKVPVFVRLAETVDAADGRHHDHVLARDQRIRRRQPVALDLLVDRRILLDVGVRLRNVSLGLVVVVVRDEVLDRVFRKQLLQLGEELRRKRLVVGQDEGRTVPPGDQVRHREWLARTGGASQDEPPVPALQPFLKRGDR